MFSNEKDISEETHGFGAAILSLENLLDET